MPRNHRLTTMPNLYYHHITIQHIINHRLKYFGKGNDGQTRSFCYSLVKDWKLFYLLYIYTQYTIYVHTSLNCITGCSSQDFIYSPYHHADKVFLIALVLRIITIARAGKRPSALLELV